MESVDYGQSFHCAWNDKSEGLFNASRCRGNEVHVISSPPIKNPCLNGIRREELIANDKSIEEIRKIIEADTLTFLSVEGTVEIGGNGEGETCGHCMACFTGKYPTEDNLEQEEVKEKLVKK